MRRLLLALLLLTSGCAHYYVNAHPRPEPGARAGPASVAGTGSVSVCLAFSGGGMRAAALSYGVLEKLRDTKVGQGERSLLEDVDCLSAVSGGAFTAAYYGLFHERLFSDFKERVLEANLQRSLEVKILASSWWLWTQSHYKRSDLAAELYGDRVFENRTFADLAGQRPFVIVNATDMALGQRFEFTQDQFDRLDSDLGPFPVARAVAASAALPFLMSTVTVVNHSTGPTELPRGIKDALAPGADRRLREWARLQALYASGDEHRFIHLTDGGVTDNTGVRALWTQLRRSDGLLRERIESGAVKKLVVIVVNALADPLRGLGERERSPNIITVAEKTARIGVNNASFETIQLLREDPALASLLARNGVEPYIVEVNFEDLPDPARRDRLRAIPTELELAPEDEAAVIAAARDLLDGSPEFRRLLADLR
jgi:predicted acylesterase/phospholipase RssA